MIEKSTKTLRNTTDSTIFVDDVGISIDAYETYTIPPQDFPYWAASDAVQPFLVDTGTLIAGDENAEITDGYFGLALLRDGIARQIAFDLDGYLGQHAFHADDTNIQKAIETARLTEIDEDGYAIVDAYQIDFKSGFNVTADGYKAIIELEVPANVSPGFTWGDSGANKNTYLLNDTVPSNQAGRVVPGDGIITEITVAVQNIPNGNPTVEIRSRSGAVFTTIVTVPVSTTQRITVYNPPSPISVAKETELTCFVGNVSLFNPVVSVAISADS